MSARHDPGAGEGPKGLGCSPIKVARELGQNVVRQFGSLSIVGAGVCVVPSLVREDRVGQTSGLPVVPPGAPLGI